MVKDYFQDIVPPSNSGNSAHPRANVPRPVHIHTEDADPKGEMPQRPEQHESFDEETVEPQQSRGIRNISIAPRSPRIRIDDELQPPGYVPPPRRFAWRSRLIWGVAGVCVLAVGGLALFALRSTSVTVTPRSHTIVFDNTAQFQSYPASSAATGTLPYTVATFDVQDSVTVPAGGTTHAESKATGEVTVYNNYSSASVRLIKDTRFVTPDGLVFRIPAAVVVPGKSGSRPGSVIVSVIADQAGQQYNVGPTAKFVIPGLQSTPQEYAQVYGASSQSMTGGFSGDKPAIDQAEAQAAISDVRTRLEAKAHASIASLTGATSTVFDGLMRISYQDLTPTVDADGKTAHLNEVAHVSIPVFPSDSFAEAIAHTVAADAQVGDVRIVGGKGYDASYADASSSPHLGSDSIVFILSGTAQVVWNIDSEALTKALAGRDSAAFQTIISGFPGIQEAHARIEPFWKTVFPADPGSIKVNVVAPAKAS